MVQLLSDTGKIAFVIPAEILQVAYAEDLRLFLSEHLAKITLITFDQLVFPDIEQEVVVFIGEKGAEEKGIRIIEMKDLDGFDSLDLKQNGFQKMQHVREKWTKYFVNAAEMELIQKIRSDTRFARFADYGLINVGITTGNNSYFSVTEDVCEKYSLESVTLPLIGRSSHAHGITFTEKDWADNEAAGNVQDWFLSLNLFHTMIIHKHINSTSNLARQRGKTRDISALSAIDGTSSLLYGFLTHSSCAGIISTRNLF